MKDAVQLFQTYLDTIQNPRAAAQLFAEEGALEIPYLKSLGIPHRVQGPEQIEAFIASLLAKVPGFKFRSIRFLIDTPEQAFAEYDVEALVPATGRVYRQSYAGRLVARDGKIQLLRESMDTVAAANAFAPVTNA
ncbi:MULTISPECIES: nuclear transport factor 2 family protein [Pseudomonas]|uniref:Nuclear transport factor 2 family protein n=1 Tax=Pseudomonas entomophila TaxID=312306 RepID=A0A3Q8U2G1_9PSED|nr:MULTISPECIES: nuclear transport factor 2 family protein [Pseudomonas]AZL69558.1 nuclear transport factor 2 family protein [Pseudomonas oryziphila]UVL87618.1 nuclear transport factor 2 family protein [Pseudomonas sichuanensis]